MRDLDAVSQLLKLLHNFENISGLEVNKHKTEAMWLGSWRNRSEKPFGFKWPHNSIYALGVHFSYDPVLANKLDFEEKVYNLEQTLHSWKRRNLTLIGRINIVKTLVLAKLIYSTSLLTTSKPLIDSINKIIFRFIWEGKPPKIKIPLPSCCWLLAKLVTLHANTEQHEVKILSGGRVVRFPPRSKEFVSLPRVWFPDFLY